MLQFPDHSPDQRTKMTMGNAKRAQQAIGSFGPFGPS